MVSKIANRRTLIGIFIVVLLLVAAWLLMQNRFVQAMLGLTPEDYVISEVKIGDSVEHLVALLKDHDVDFYREKEDDRILYCMGDGFMGVCFYYVTNGKVVDIVFD